MYAANGCIYDACHLFDRMPVRDVVPYSTMVAAYSRSGDMNMAFLMYKKMLNDGIRPNSVTLLGLLSGVSRLGQVQCLHALVIALGFENDLIVMNSLMNVYFLCGRAHLARVLFDSMAQKDKVSWNIMLAGNSRSGSVRDSKDLLHRMRFEGFFPDQQTFASLLSLITNCSSLLRFGLPIHALILTSGFGSDSHIVTTLMSFYLKSSNLDAAFMFFDRSTEKDVVLWTAMISGLAQNGHPNEALFIFHQMLTSTGLMPTNITIASAMSACAQLSMFRIGFSIHGFIIRQQLPMDTTSVNSLITFYAKCFRLRQSKHLFETIQGRDLVSWNAIISGFAHSGHLEDAFCLFNGMILANQRPNVVTVVSLLQGCASFGVLHQGKQLHSFIIRNHIDACISVDTSLVDMYGKCGDLKSAQSCFDRMIEQDVVSWSVIISGYGNHGKGDVALRIYNEFIHTEMLPNDVMFLSVLSACSHSGLVSEGLAIFKSMKDELGIEPRSEHLACIVDLLCRAGDLEEAVRFLRTMLSNVSIDVWGIILDACRACGSADLAEEVVKEMIALKPESAGSYVQLAHTYATIDRWDGVAESWRKMRALGLKKTPGWSFVEVNGSLSTFFADHTSHPHWEEIACLFRLFEREMKDIMAGSLNS
ncbi:hypothetical protein HPP92_016366 [Vanilla planifolia]|uniref:Pentatricopeptide repeat-containing protein n=1 Tax=Vanilla planifolia TaxID=51239 RepID=A0A835QF41_VANPL|nr:hypothetical protein HPP92_016366 [Vanilla planifolia]